MELRYMRNLKNVCGQPHNGSFGNLAKLYIKGCDNLEYVFNPCMARFLVHLHTLIIDDCRSLKEVVAAENDEDVEDEYSNSILPKLRFLTLDSLSSLGKFCHIANDIEFCELDYVYVIDCPEFKTFAPGFVHTPSLNRVKLIYGRETWKENLNNTVQHLYEDQQQRRQKQEDEKEDANENDIKEDS